MAKPPRTISLSELAHEALRRQLREICRCEAGTRRGRDIEALHDMRVAVRRSRAAISLFRRVLDPGFRALGRDLKWLGDELGCVRDLDVLIKRIEAMASEAPAMSVKELRPVMEALIAQRNGARSRLVVALDSATYARLMAQFRGLLRETPLAAEPASEGVTELVMKRKRAFERAASSLGSDSSAKLRHRVRILAKRYRYLLEFTAECLSESERRLPKRLASLQDVLGVTQDAAVAIERLHALAEANPECKSAGLELAHRFAKLGRRESKRSDRQLEKLLG